MVPPTKSTAASQIRHVPRLSAMQLESGSCSALMAELMSEIPAMVHAWT